MRFKGIRLPVYESCWVLGDNSIDVDSLELALSYPKTSTEIESSSRLGLQKAH